MTGSTTRSVLTRGCRGASPRNSHGTPRPSPKHPGRSTPAETRPRAARTATAQLPGAAATTAPDGVAPSKHNITTDAQAQPDLETGTIEKLAGTVSHPADNGRQQLRVQSNGVVKIVKTLFSVTTRMGGRTVVAVRDRDGVVFASTAGEITAEYHWPPEGTKYVGMSQARTRFRR